MEVGTPHTPAGRFPAPLLYYHIYSLHPEQGRVEVEEEESKLSRR